MSAHTHTHTHTQNFVSWSRACLFVSIKPESNSYSCLFFLKVLCCFVRRQMDETERNDFPLTSDFIMAQEITTSAQRWCSKLMIFKIKNTPLVGCTIQYWLELKFSLHLNSQDVVVRCQKLLLISQLSAEINTHQNTVCFWLNNH